ncbi:MAG: lasso peptide biosynthesis B2 protein [Jaaginema sp. PMC 1079.18]|nr:lasso peptide biosynthesis B2 protein [Jaaginema sp. PMC 1079.18]
MSLSRSDRVLLWQTIMLLLVIKLGLKFTTVKQLRRQLQQYTRFKATVSRPSSRLIWAVEAATRLLPGNTKCLAKALAAQTLLLRHNYPAKVRLGVAKDALGDFEAHAWVESEGKVAIGQLQDGERFKPLVDW